MRSKFFVILGALGLVLVYVFQAQIFNDPLATYLFNPMQPVIPEYNKATLALSKALRYLLNDGFALMLIWGLFKNPRYVRFAVFVFLFGFLILLPLYLFILFNFFLESQSFINHLHRIVLNPVLMMLLIPAFYHQQSLTQKQKK